MSLVCKCPKLFLYSSYIIWALLWGFGSAETNSTTDNFNFLNNDPVAIYPKNITDVYKGIWVEMEESPGFKILEFEKKKGSFLFDIINKPTSAENMHSIEGDLVLRDGLYSTDKSHRFVLQGFYYAPKGLLFFLAQPDRALPLMKNLPIDYSADIDVESFVNQAEMEIMHALQNQSKRWNDIDPSLNITHPETPSYDGVCVFLAMFQVENVSSTFDEANAKFYEFPTSYEFEEDEPQKVALHLKGISRSPNCDIQISIDTSSMLFREYHSKAIYYGVAVAISCFLEIMVIIRQMEHTNTQTMQTRVSMLSIGIQAMMDSYLCLIQLSSGIISEPIFNAFAVAAFFKFINFSLFEMRYVLNIWKATQPQMADWAVMRRELSFMYLKFYAFLSMMFMMLYWLSALLYVFIFALYSFWVPQIITNVKRDSNGALLKKYIGVVSVTRMLIPLYFFAYPSNFGNVETHPVFSLVLIAWMIFQVAVLLAQDVLGPRFFVPAMFLPVKYNYQRSLETEVHHDCVICMTQVDISTGEKYMVTPCNHVFHEECLQRWMEQKMQCPTCRTQLPIA